MLSVAHQYQVRIPEWARRFFGGADRLRKRFTSKSAGQAWVARTKHQLAQLKAGAEAEDAGIASPRRQITIEQACTQWLASLQRRPRTIQSYRWTLEPNVYPHIGRAPLAEFNLAAWDLYARIRRAEGASEDALLRERQAIQAAAKWARARGYAVHDQVALIPRPKPAPTKQRRFDPARVRRALARMKGRSRIIAELAAGTGMRLAELRAALVEWIDWRTATMEIPHTKAFSPKGARPRRLPLARKLVLLLKSWIGARTQGLLFPPEARQKAGASFAAWRVVADLRAAGLTGATLHDLRHHYISTLAARGLDLRTVQELAGHRYSKTTDLYMHVAPDHLARARQALELDSELDSRRGRKRSR